ncbi:MAG: hypothetical protein ABGX07_03090, partial [Pirellulaceae bacterium]
LTSLMEAADRVDSTVGVQMAYLKNWAPRALQPLQLRDPQPLPRSPHGKAEAHRLEAREAAATLEARSVAFLETSRLRQGPMQRYRSLQAGTE